MTMWCFSVLCVCVCVFCPNSDGSCFDYLQQFLVFLDDDDEATTLPYSGNNK